MKPFLKRVLASTRDHKNIKIKSMDHIKHTENNPLDFSDVCEVQITKNGRYANYKSHTPKHIREFALALKERYDSGSVK